jgi:hypothetical protein
LWIAHSVSAGLLRFSPMPRFGIPAQLVLEVGGCV